MIKHLDLFSGIGGFALAADRIWGKENVEHIFCDNDKFCQEVLKKHWAGSKIYGDIRTITDTELCRPHNKKNEQVVERKGGGEPSIEQPRSVGRPFLLTGGFPCQPFSQAGRRKGTEDNRYLWGEMFRVIQLTKPEWVIAENVRGLLTIGEGMVFEQVCLDLESAGYEVQPLIIPAVAKNAPHRRDRVWFVAHRKGNGIQRRVFKSEPNTHLNENNFDAQNSISKRSGGRSENGRQILERQAAEIQTPRPDSEGGDALNATGGRRQQHTPIGKTAEDISDGCERNEWERNWFEVATEFCRVDDGLPIELDGLKLSKSGHRRERLKSLGNSIVPQVAEEIMKAIKFSETLKSEEK